MCTLPLYRGDDPRVNATLSNEFAVVGYRAHSMIHGQFDVAYNEGAYSPTQLEAFQAQGIGVGEEDGLSALNIPLSVAFGNPDLLPQVGLGAVLQSLSAEREYRNDEQIDNTLRSVLFEVPRPGTTDPAACQVPVVDPLCFSGVADLGALDVERGRDHGMPSYNDLRRAYGLTPKRSFTAITGEATDQFPADPMIDSADAINDPNILDFVQLRDADGNVLDPADPNIQEEAVSGDRRSTLAARLRAVYGNVSKVDSFVGMVSEPHARGSEFGSLQLAIWRTQFASATRRRPLLLRQRPGTYHHQAQLRRVLPPHARRARPNEQRRGGARRRVQGGRTAGHGGRSPGRRPRSGSSERGSLHRDHVTGLHPHDIVGPIRLDDSGDAVRKLPRHHAVNNERAGDRAVDERAGIHDESSGAGHHRAGNHCHESARATDQRATSTMSEP